MQDRVWKAFYKWIADKTVVTDHISGTVRQSADHVYELSKFVDYPHNLPYHLFC
ncbi:hypothetical protein MUO98_04055 [Candidatus Bathyarchaeota archaeon]|nr:hypothetical protein [Candidatus Bathyarchaeota archaeon]